MTDDQDRIDILNKKLDNLVARQKTFITEINALSRELKQLKAGDSSKEVETVQAENTETNITPVPQSNYETETTYSEQPVIKPTASPIENVSNKRPKFNLEKFIGENLLTKIGILILIIGVIIGAQYSIEHDLLSPLTRIVMGYVSGITLLGFGIWLKGKYESYSAVLVSGAIAILYVITYLAHDFYSLIPMLPAFGMMFLFTIFSVIAAINYNRQVIAHIGLVGAYALPFLLGNKDGNITVLFSYVAVINCGILVIALMRYWKPLLISSFLFTWAIYGYWFSSNYADEQTLKISFFFLIIYFLIFYLAFLAYKVYNKEIFKRHDVLLILANSFVFFGFGYVLMSDHEATKNFLGLFALANAAIHFLVSVVLYNYKLADKKLFYLVSGLVLVFLTMAIPIQLDGSWVTIFWAAEAALLFWLGRTKSTPIYEYLSYPVMVLALFSMSGQWSEANYHYSPSDPSTRVTPFINVYFLSAILFVAAFVIINIINRDKRYALPNTKSKNIRKLIQILIPGILFFGLYRTFSVELDTYWQQLYKDARQSLKNSGLYGKSYASDLRKFRDLWQINYALFFFGVLMLVNQYKFKIRKLAAVAGVFIVLAILVFLGDGLLQLNHLRDNFLSADVVDNYDPSLYNILFRYLCYLFLVFAFYALYRFMKSSFIAEEKNLGFLGITPMKLFDIFTWLSLIVVGSNELITVMSYIGSENSDKLGLTILWGCFSLALIALGIWQNKQHLRIIALVLFTIALIKLFFYDVAHLDTISKTILFITLGVLLLIISFLYNKYKDRMKEHDEDRV